MLQQLHHIAVIATDYERVREFYIEKLGFTLIREVWREKQQDYLRLLQLSDIVIELFIRPDAPARVTNPEALGLRHLAFRVTNAETAAAWLHDMGIETEPIRTDPVNGGRFTFFRDPDGLPLEIHE